MDLEEMSDNIQTQLEEIKQQISDLKNSSTSTNSQTTSLIFNELRTLLKEQNEQGRNNLNENAKTLKENAESIYNNLKKNADELTRKIENATNGMSGTMARATESVCNFATAGIKNTNKELFKFKNEYKESIEKDTENGTDEITRPSHYCEGIKYEPKDVIRDWDLNFNLGNVVKYVSRNGRKPHESSLKDLEKARQYLDFEIAAIKEDSSEPGIKGA